jgi:hypothetical protein
VSFEDVGWPPGGSDEYLLMVSICPIPLLVVSSDAIEFVVADFI